MDSIGYCTNVHPGHDLATTWAHLHETACAVKAAVSPQDDMPIGLWFSWETARQLTDGKSLTRFRDDLLDQGLVPLSLNGFPYGDFHQERVKKQVYHPTWMDSSRLEYTLALCHILAALVPAHQIGTISTLPVIWGEPQPSAEQLRVAAGQLRTVAHELNRIETASGRRIWLCLEPEPGCHLQRSSDLVRFYEEFLCRGGHDALVRRYLGVCHDVCHSAVMFEPQAEAWQNYRQAGIAVPKVQVSSALRARFSAVAPEKRSELLRELARFAEDRYLHQTMVAAGGALRFHEDLPQALADVRVPDGEWRIHFHVPIFASELGSLDTTQDDIGDLRRCLAESPEHPYVEVETYAWEVLPRPLQENCLADGIARELRWCAEAWNRMANADPCRMSDVGDERK